MKNPVGFSLAVLATAGFALAGGEGEKKGGEKAAKSDSSKKLLNTIQDGVSYKAGKGLVFTSEKFSVGIKHQLQTQWSYSQLDPGNDTHGFNIRRARTSFDGYAYRKEIRFKLQGQWNSGTNPIKDAFVDWTFHQADNYSIAVRFGQMKSQFGKEWRDSSSKLQFVDRALATSTFSGVRSRGAFVHGSTGAGDGKLKWSVGAQNSDVSGDSTSGAEEGNQAIDNSDNEVNFVFSVDYMSNGYAKGQGHLDRSKTGWGAGAAYYLGNARSGVSPVGVDIETSSANVWGGWRGNGVDLTGEYFMRTDEVDGGADADGSGFQVAATYTLPKEGENWQWGFGLRYSMIDLDANQILLTGSALGANTADAEANEIEVGVSAYDAGHNHKIQGAIVLREIDNATATATVDQTALTVQHTIIF